MTETSAPTVPAEDLTETELSPSDLPLTVERLAEENRRHDRILAGLVVALSFLLASFPVTNSDIWMHLRVGQMIVNGEFTFGQDPFSYTSAESARWVHPGWLFDVFLYCKYVFAGRLVDESQHMALFGAILVLCRGVAIALLSLLLLGIRKPGVSFFPVVVCVALAVLTLSQRLWLRSEIVSYLFLGLTLYLLWRRPERLATSPSGPRPSVGVQRRSWLFLPPLFALWANLDQFFFLGPVIVGLYFIGELLQDSLGGNRFREDAFSPAERGRLFLVLLIGTAACLINPYHIHVFQLPGEWWSKAFDTFKARETAFRLGLSPFDSVYFNPPRDDRLLLRPWGLTVAEWSYYALALLGLVSFVANLRNGRWWRFLIWAVFFGLSVWQARNIGLFAVVAAPIAGLNFQDCLAAEPSIRKRSVAISQLVRVLVLFCVIVLGALMFIRLPEPSTGLGATEAPLGLVHSRGAIGWSILYDPSLRDSGIQLARWRSENRLPGRSFHASWREFPDYWAWFAPENRTFIDHRFAVHSGDVAGEFFTAMQALRNTGTAKANQFHWAEVFRKHDISHLVVSGSFRVIRPDPPDPRDNRQFRVRLVDVLLSDRANWELLDYHDGRTFILAWKKSPHWEMLSKLQFSANRKAFQDASAVPEPAERQAAFGLTSWLAGDALRRPLGCDEAVWHIERHSEIDGRLRERLFSRTTFATILGSLVQSPSSVVAGAPALSPPRVESPTGAWLYLALRASRRAAAENPDYADTHLLLFNIYREIIQFERQMHPPERPIPAPVVAMRDLQARSALFRGISLRTSDLGDMRSLEIAFQQHRELAQIYYRQNFLDLAVEQAQKAMQVRRLPGPPPGVAREDFERSLQNLSRQILQVPLDQAETLKREREANYDTSVPIRTSVLERAQTAMRLQLVVKARSQLELAVQSRDLPPSQLTQAFQLLVELYLGIGDVQAAEMLLGRGDAPAHLGPVQFDQVSTLVAAANGHYEKAIAHRVAIEKALQQYSVERSLTGFKLQTLGGSLDPPGSSLTGIRIINQAFDAAYQRTEQICQMGLLALEAGRTKEAAEYFRKGVRDVAAESPYRTIAGRYYYLITGRHLEESP